jgi:anti-anti-sigma factor
MKIETDRRGGAVELRLAGRLDRESAERLSDTIEDLLQAGVRSVNLDCAAVTYASTAATSVLTRWRQELAVLRGEMHLHSVPPAVRDVLGPAGGESGDADAGSSAAGLAASRHSTWYSRAELAASGTYEVSANTPAGTLTCQLHGDPDRLTRAPYGPGDCPVVAFPEGTFGLGVGAIGTDYEESHERFGELVGVGGCLAHFPTGGARMADYLVGSGREGDTPRAVLASGLTCQGGFSHLVRFTTRPEAAAVALPELATIGLETVGGRIAGLVIAGETAGLAGARLKRSPALETAPLRYELPGVRDWLMSAPERTHAMTTTIIVGVVAREPKGPLASHLRPLEASGKLQGHFHAAVFSYHPVPQRTVELAALVRGLFANYQLRDVLHLLWDHREEAGVGDTALLRGVCWVAPITQVS